MLDIYPELCDYKLRCYHETAMEILKNEILLEHKMRWIESKKKSTVRVVPMDSLYHNNL